MKNKNEIVRVLIESLDKESLELFVARLNKTRRRYVEFALNGERVITTRKWARDAYVERLKKLSEN